MEPRDDVATRICHRAHPRRLRLERPAHLVLPLRRHVLTLLLFAPALALALPLTVRDAVAVGDCDTVHAAISSPATDEQRLATGACHQRQGRHADAEQVLAPVTAGVYGDYARLVRGSALADLERYADALAAVEGLDLPAGAGLQARLVRGRSLVMLDRSLDARTGLRELLTTVQAVEARYWLAVGGERRGDTAAAVATYQRVWADDPTGVWSDRAASALAGFEQPVPDFSTDEGRALARARAATLAAAHDHGGARALLEHVDAATVSEGSGITLARARFRARDYPAAVAAYEGVLGSPPRAIGEPRDLFDYALATSRTGDYDTAAVIYARLVDQHPGSTRGDEASFKLGYLEYDRGNCAAATERFAEHVARMPGSTHLDEALWFQSRCAWRSGDAAATERALDALIEARPSSSLVAGARYWKARARGRSGDAEGEADALAGVIARHPTTGYAWFAAERLGRTSESRTAMERPPWPEHLAADPAVRRSEALLEAGFPRWAAGELDALHVAHDDMDAALASAHAHIAAGAYLAGKALAEPWCRSGLQDAPAPVAGACLPRPEASIVTSVADRFDLDPLLPYAIMTAESGLDPAVTSIAGARGLMQIMPAEAPRIHAALFGDQPHRPQDLYDPSYNAAIGTAELGLKQRSLGDVLDGPDLPAVIASYNGGEEAVRRWLGAWDEPPEFDEFAEDIGYTETRQYVKRVLGYLMAYRWVYGSG